MHCLSLWPLGGNESLSLNGNLPLDMIVGYKKHPWPLSLNRHHHHHQFMKNCVRKEKDRLATGPRWMEREACRFQKAIRKLNVRWNRVFIARQNVRQHSKEKNEVAPELSEEFKSMLNSSMAIAGNLCDLIDRTSKAEGENAMEALMAADTDVLDSDSDEEDKRKEEEKDEGVEEVVDGVEYQMY